MNELLSQSMIDDIELDLGRKILSSEAGDRNSLAEFTSSDIEDIRIIGKRNAIYAILYIKFRLKRDLKLGLAKTHYDDVIKNERPFEEWNKYKPPLDEQFHKDEWQP